jgi:hypothetical protein
MYAFVIPTMERNVRTAWMIGPLAILDPCLRLLSPEVTLI